MDGQPNAGGDMQADERGQLLMKIQALRQQVQMPAQM